MWLTAHALQADATTALYRIFIKKLSVDLDTTSLMYLNSVLSLVRFATAPRRTAPQPPLTLRGATSRSWRCCACTLGVCQVLPSPRARAGAR